MKRAFQNGNIATDKQDKNLLMKLTVATEFNIEGRHMKSRLSNSWLLVMKPPLVLALRYRTTELKLT